MIKDAEASLLISFVSKMQHILYKTGKRSLQIRIRAWNWIRDSMVASGYKDFATLEYRNLQQKVTNLKQNAKRENDKKAQNKPCNKKTWHADV